MSAAYGWAEREIAVDPYRREKFGSGRASPACLTALTWLRNGTMI
jgi:hypothetical protein